MRIRGFLMLSAAACAILSVLGPRSLHAETEPALTSLPGDPAARLFKLGRNDYFVMLEEYDLAGQKLKPMIDTGSTLLLIPAAAFNALPMQALPPEDVSLQLAGIENAQLGLLQVEQLGSAALKWQSVGGLDLASGEDGEPSDSIMPLSMLDADYCIFFLSRQELWLSNVMPDIESADPLVPVRSIPYYDTSNGPLVLINVDGVSSWALLDTGADGSYFVDTFVAAHPESFKQSSEPQTISGVGSEEESAGYGIAGQVSIIGLEPADDVALGGEIYSFSATGYDGGDAPVDEQGDPSMAPYIRSDLPGIAPVALIGMDVFGRYDFMFDRADKLLLLWDPQDTPAAFGLPE